VVRSLFPQSNHNAKTAQTKKANSRKAEVVGVRILATTPTHKRNQASNVEIEE